MAAQAGKSILIQLNTTGSTYVDLAGLRTKEIKIANEYIDITNSDSVGRWREYLGGGAISSRSISVSGGGVFLDAAIDANIQTEMFAATLKNYKIIIPDFGTFQGSFAFTELSYSGDHDGEVTYDMSIESSGAVTFTAI